MSKKGADLYKQVGQKTIQDVTEPMEAAKKKRAAPKQRRKKAEVKVTGAWKLPPGTKEAVDRAAAEYGVEKGQLVNFLLRSSLTLLASDKIELPVREREEGGPVRDVLDIPIPEQFKE